MRSCLICRSSGIKQNYYNAAFRVSTIDCFRCGNFTITDECCSELTDELRPYLSAASRQAEHPPLEITQSNWRGYAEAHRLTTYSAKKQKVLARIAAVVGRAGGKPYEADFHCDLPLFDAVDEKEFQAIIDHLIEEDLIHKVPNTGNSAQYRPRPAGWRAIEGGSVMPQTPSPTAAAVPTRDIFLVHGRHEASKQAVARFLAQLRFNPVILHEQADKGRTIIQKFEDHSKNVGFAVVILAPDDEGRLQGTADLKPRARQNVILELGYFIGKLKRTGVCALKIGDVEEPSDLLGVMYVPYDEAGAWKTRLARELRAAAFEVDMNLI